jgi:TonB family protein
MKRVRMKDRKLMLEISSGADGNFDKAINAIFAPDLSSLIPTLPAFWQTYAEYYFPALDAGPNSTPPVRAQPMFARGDNRAAPEPIMHIGGRVKAPTMLWNETPKFTPTAKALKYSGNVRVYLWVSKGGTPSHISVANAAGLGLDEAAVEAVKRYRFAPATLDGRPVTVDIFMDVNFQVF